MAQYKEMWSFSVSMICRNINIHSSDWAVNVLSQKSTLPPGNRNLLAFPVQGECLKYTALQQLDRLNTSTCDRADESLTPGMKERRDSFISQAGQQLHTANWLMAGFLPFFFLRLIPFHWARLWCQTMSILGARRNLRGELGGVHLHSRPQGANAGLCLLSSIHKNPLRQGLCWLSHTLLKIITNPKSEAKRNFSTLKRIKTCTLNTPAECTGPALDWKPADSASLPKVRVLKGFPTGRSAVPLSSSSEHQRW